MKWNERLLAWLASWPGTAMAAGLVVLCSWPRNSVVPESGLDNSWLGGLYMASRHGMNFGTDIVFTYGPLGFLSGPRSYYALQGQLALVFQFAAYFAVAFMLIAGIRKALGSQWIGLLVGALIGLVVVGLIPSTDTALLVGVMFSCVYCVLDGFEGRRLRGFAIALGVIAAIALMIKLSTGVAAGGLIVFTLLTRDDRWRSLLRFVAALGGAFLLLWLVTGNALFDIPAFIGNTLSVASAYSSAMSLDMPPTDSMIFAALLLAAGGFVVAFICARGRGVADRVALLGLWTLLVLAGFKFGFVRSDRGHLLLYFSALIPCLFAFMPRGGDRAAWLAVAISTFTLIVVAHGIQVAFWGSSGSEVQIAESLRSFKNQARVVFGGGAFATEAANSRARMQINHPLEPEGRALIGDRSVHIYPYEANIAWALGLNWRPLPVFQNYSAYSNTLDDLNAERIYSPSAPEFILRNLDPPIDGRNLAHESPAATVAMICRYREAFVGARLEVLRRGPNRCGRERLIGVNTVKIGDPVAVPKGKANELVIARIDGVAGGGLEKLRKSLYRAEPFFVEYDGALYRLMRDTADNGLLVRLPEQIDYTAPFSLRGGIAGAPPSDANIDSITLRGPLEAKRGDYEMKVSFYAVEVADRTAGDR